MSARRALGLAATPVFAGMALLSLLEPASAHAASGPGMWRMYALMAIFHAGPWLPADRRAPSPPRLTRGGAPSDHD